MANVPVAGAPATITTNCRATEQGQMPPSLAGHCCQPGELYFALVLAWACFFVVTPAFAC
jgi:hypothetical protein